jgi:hypothetical protein
MEARYHYIPFYCYQQFLLLHFIIIENYQPVNLQ